MLSNPTAGRRLAGRMIVLAGIAVALPLTASRAIHYVEVPMVSASEPLAAPAAVAAVQVAPAVQAVPAVQPVSAVQAPAAPQPAAPIRQHSNLSLHDGTVIINGERKEWKDLTPDQKAQVRNAIAEAKASLSKVNIQDIQREVSQSLQAAKIDQDQLRRNIENARGSVDQAVKAIDANAVELRAHGQDPEALKARVRASLASLDAEKISRQVQAANPERIAASIAKAQDGIRRAEAEIARMEALDRGD